MNKSPETISGATLEDVIEHVRDMVGMFRKSGEKTEFALPLVAAELEIKPSRVKSLFYRDRLWGMNQEEAERIKARFVVWLGGEIQRRTTEIERLRQKRDGVQARLKCSKHSSGYTSNGLLSRSAA